MDAAMTFDHRALIALYSQKTGHTSKWDGVVNTALTKC